jgi:small subunit ribosomal protein S16
MSCGSEIVHLHPKETFVAVRIRMKKLGRKHRPFFRICVMDSRSPRDGKAIEEIGFYDPMVRVKKDRVKLDLERVDYWIGVGAQPSVNVAALIKKVRTNRFGEAAAPPPLTAPKARPAKVAETEEAPQEATTES